MISAREQEFSCNIFFSAEICDRFFVRLMLSCFDGTREEWDYVERKRNQMLVSDFRC